jgi:hypothetical protein
MGSQIRQALFAHQKSPSNRCQVDIYKLTAEILITTQTSQTSLQAAALTV